MNRMQTRPIDVGGVRIGGQDRVVIQSMTNTRTKDIEATVAQIRRLEDAGCEIIRVAILDMEDARAVSQIKKQIRIPLVCDIHFNPDFALEAIRQGTDKIRLNPGNIEDETKIREIVTLCKEKHIPIRIGINAGSLNRKYSHSEEAMIESAKDHLRILEEMDFHDVCLSFKSSDPLECIKAYRLASQTFPYPLHLGVTEAGGLLNSTIKSSLALGNLLLDGIGDTIRISVSDDPIEEIRVAKKLLRACGLRRNVANLISCPTCGRIQYDMLPIVKEMEEWLDTVDKDVTVAIMGCPVNGPQEASRADIGVAGGKDSAVLFKKGKIVRTIPQEQIVSILKQEVEAF
ncbi:MAG: flavodoxin-dependent (E)-4-hydroxy-3-methylbut-2-enyl-diphosphate synthase [Erysipelotrichaceae bacterium]|nr:flavodoxin-dependent (E)-4-hydroxy-3-methylbut-2-enyl-diphosphate synthase [Erysipelotrichaceae bacterium]MBQ2582676.1 flavodoxin-dependent (E)-4-hydroxy-3-methylbut-2-enyl-diphosphate synthase [Erysipelotrichaceae bacterium]